MTTTTVPSDEPKTDTELFIACINLRWPDTGNQERAIKHILNHPKIKRKIDFESKKFSELNSELDREDLKQEIKTLLYLAIKKEFTLALDPAKMEGWLCSRIAWRTLDHISKECDLIYSTNEETGETEYKRFTKISIDQPGQTTTELKRIATLTVNRGKTLNTTVSFGDMIPASVERHKTFEGFLRKARIKTSHKHVLMYVVAMNYNFRELADVYKVSSPTARKLYARAVLALRRYILSLCTAEQSSVKNLLKGVYERS